MDAKERTDRIFFIDIARFYAIALVFYGHFIEELMLLKNPSAASQYKFIYSFHMVLFIVLAGYVSKEQAIDWGINKFLKHWFFSRFLPYLFFNLLMMVPPVFFEGKFFGMVLPSVGGYTKGIVNTAFGLPSFCIPSWFLMLIIGVELVHYGAFRYLRTSDARLLTAVVAFYILGYLLNLKIDIFNPLRDRIVGWNYFFLHEAVALYAFYLLGIILQRRGVVLNRLPIRSLLPGAALAFLIVFFTYPLNNGPFNFPVYDAVVILFASHGNILLFPLTAMAGCALVLLFAGMSRPQKAIVWLGQNTLILMCLNGFFYHYLNPPTAKWIMENLPNSAAVVFAAGCAMTVVSLAICIPSVFLFNRYLPQLVGKPKRKGPIFNNFI